MPPAPISARRSAISLRCCRGRAPWCRRVSRLLFRPATRHRFGRAAGLLFKAASRASTHRGRSTPTIAARFAWCLANLGTKPVLYQSRRSHRADGRRTGLACESSKSSRSSRRRRAARQASARRASTRDKRPISIIKLPAGARSVRTSAICCVSVGVDVILRTARSLGAGSAVRCRRGHYRDEVLRHRRRNRNPACGHRLSGEMRLSSRRKTASATRRSWRRRSGPITSWRRR